MQTLRHTIEDWYRNSPDWPLPLPADLHRDARAFLADESPFSFDEVVAEMERFWATAEAESK